MSMARPPPSLSRAFRYLQPRRATSLTDTGNSLVGRLRHRTGLDCRAPVLQPSPSLALTKLWASADVMETLLPLGRELWVPPSLPSAPQTVDDELNAFDTSEQIRR